MEDDKTPDPLDTVTLLQSDFNLLQAAANAAMEDFQNLCNALGVTPEPGKAPREVMHEVLLPMVVGLKRTQEMVGEADAQLRAAAARHGNQTIELGNGQKGLLVGRKDPSLLAGLQPATRRERRELERRRRP